MPADCIRVGVPTVQFGMYEYVPDVPMLHFEMKYENVRLTTGGVHITEHWTKEGTVDTIEFNTLVPNPQLQVGMETPVRLIMPLDHLDKQESITYEKATVFEISRHVVDNQPEIHHFVFKCNRAFKTTEQI